MDENKFARFLELLSPDSEEAGRRYASLHRKLTGFFSLKGTSDPVSAANETLDRAVLKIGAGAVVPDAVKYCSGIARNVAKERLREMRREASAFQGFIEGLRNSAGQQVERIYTVLKPCFEQLLVEDQELLRAYCAEIQGRARAKHRRELAESLMTNEFALRVRVSRLREKLAKCVEKLST